MTPLATLRRHKAWSQRELASRAGVSQSVIAMLETRTEAKRTRYPKFKVVRAVSAALGVEPGDIDEFRLVVGPAPNPDRRRLAA